MNDVWLVRHGETEWTLSKKHTSRTDVELTEAGREQAHGLARVLANRDFALVLTSPRERARRTAELAGFPDARADDELVEIDYGEYEGRTSDEIRAERPGWYLWSDGSPGGETPEDAGRRADRVIERLRTADGPALVFGHGHMSRILGARLLGLPAADGRLLILDPASIAIVGSEHDRPAIRLWNWSPTLE
ncbi:MAG: histidine phosphatase family protein [Thermoleophilaceae bacterium]